MVHTHIVRFIVVNLTEICNRRTEMNIIQHFNKLVFTSLLLLPFNIAYSATCKEVITQTRNCAAGNPTVKDVKTCMNQAPALVDQDCEEEIQLRNEYDGLENQLINTITTKYREFEQNDPDFKVNVVERHNNLVEIQGVVQQYSGALKQNVEDQIDFVQNLLSMKDSAHEFYFPSCVRTISTAIDFSNDVDAISKYILDLIQLKEIEIGRGNDQLAEFNQLKTDGRVHLDGLAYDLSDKVSILENEDVTIDFSEFLYSEGMNQAEKYLNERRRIRVKAINSVINSATVKKNVLFANETGVFGAEEQEAIIESQKQLFKTMVVPSEEKYQPVAFAAPKLAGFIYQAPRYEEAREILRIVQICELASGPSWADYACDDVMPKKDQMEARMNGGIESDIRMGIDQFYADGDIYQGDHERVLNALDLGKIELAAMIYDMLLDAIEESADVEI